MTEEEKRQAEEFAKLIHDTRQIAESQGGKLKETEAATQNLKAEVEKLRADSKAESEEMKKLLDGQQKSQEQQTAELKELIAKALRPLPDYTNREEKKAADLTRAKDLFGKAVKYFHYMGKMQIENARKYALNQEELKNLCDFNGHECGGTMESLLQAKTDIIPDETKTTMTTYRMPTAGVLMMPALLLTEIFDLAQLQTTNIAQYSKQITIREYEIEMPTQASHGQAGWTYEAATRAKSTTPTFGSKKFTLNQAYAYLDISQQMLNFSSIDLAGYMATEYARLFGKLIGTAHISGSGVGVPEGVLTNSSIAKVLAHETTEITTGDYLKELYFTLKSYYRGGSRWVFNSMTAWQLSCIKDGAGRYILHQLPDSPQFNLMGLPTTISEDMPDIASGAYPIVLGNFGLGYQVVNNNLGTMQIVDPYTAKATGLVEYFTWLYTTAGVLIPEAFKIFETSA